MKKMINVFFYLFLFSAVTCFANQITVVKQAGFANPKLLYSPMSGNQEFSSYVLSNLKNCGWFEVVSSGTARYNISGTVSGSKATINVSGEKNFSVTVNIDSSKPKWSSYKLVDAVLNKIFNIPGVCASKIVFVAQNGKSKDLCTSDFDGSNVKQITSSNNLTLEPSWSMNNTLIVYTLIHNNYADIVGLNLNTNKNTILANFPGLNNGGTISPNGKQMAVILSKDKNVDLYVKDVYGSGVKRITKGKGTVAGCPTWSPDGRKLCFVSNMKMERPSLYIADLASNKIYPIPTIGGEAVNPSWSPDGSKIVYSAKMGGNYTLGLYDVAGGVSTLVDVNSSGDWFSPSWAPDSRQVVCSRRVNYFSQLYVVDTLSGEARQLVNSKMNVTSPSWSELYK